MLRLRSGGNESDAGSAVTDEIEPPLKASHPDYNPAPFFFVERNSEGNVRLVAWTGEIDQLRTSFRRVIDGWEDTLDVLFKTEQNPETGDWTRYYGRLSAPKFKDAIPTFDEIIFRDGGSVLCVKDARSGDYLALDQNGILFVYSNDPGFVPKFKELGFEMRKNKLIDEKAHWNVHPKNAGAKRKLFVEHLGLTLG